MGRLFYNRSVMTYRFTVSPPDGTVTDTVVRDMTFDLTSTLIDWSVLSVEEWAIILWRAPYTLNNPVQHEALTSLITPLSRRNVKVAVSVMSAVTRTPANKRRWPNVGWMLGQRRRRWPSIQPLLVQNCVPGQFQLIFLKLVNFEKC